MAEVHQFTYGAFNPIAAALVAFLGTFLGLLSAGRARDARSRGRRTRWLVIASFAIGGGAIWLMHFVAILGFDVPASPVRFDAVLTLLSLVFAVTTVGVGLIVVGHGRRSFGKTVFAGVLTGVGVVAMHFTGMAALHVQGTLRYRPALVAACVVIAVVAATATLWFAVTVRGWGPITGASALVSLAACGMHYTGMAAVEVELSSHVPATVSGIRPLIMIVPITVVSAATILGVALSALQAMTEEEFTDGTSRPAGPAGSTKLRRTRGRRPSPRPVPGRTADAGPQPVSSS